MPVSARRKVVLGLAGLAEADRLGEVLHQALVVSQASVVPLDVDEHRARGGVAQVAGQRWVALDEEARLVARVVVARPAEAPVERVAPSVVPAAVVRRVAPVAGGRPAGLAVAVLLAARVEPEVPEGRGEVPGAAVQAVLAEPDMGPSTGRHLPKELAPRQHRLRRPESVHCLQLQSPSRRPQVNLRWPPPRPWPVAFRSQQLRQRRVQSCRSS